MIDLAKRSCCGVGWSSADAAAALVEAMRADILVEGPESACRVVDDVVEYRLELLRQGQEEVREAAAS